MENMQTGAHPSPHVSLELSETGKWLTVADAVVFCTERALPRTPKTIRKWAARSYMNPENADISVRREDTGNGFRWSIEASSLDRKVSEELEFERRKTPDSDGIGAHQVEHVPTNSDANFVNEPPKNTSEPVRTGEDECDNNRIETELRAQLEQARAEVDFLRDELIHRRQTDKALGSVIEAFKLNAETTRAQSVGRKPLDPEFEGGGQLHDIVPVRRETDQP